ncbi:hypothetical protein ABZP36_016115 [Zizania latifolia]
MWPSTTTASGFPHPLVALLSIYPPPPVVADLSSLPTIQHPASSQLRETKKALTSVEDEACGEPAGEAEGRRLREGHQAAEGTALHHPALRRHAPPLERLIRNPPADATDRSFVRRRVGWPVPAAAARKVLVFLGLTEVFLCAVPEWCRQFVHRVPKWYR